LAGGRLAPFGALPLGVAAITPQPERRHVPLPDVLLKYKKGARAPN
jgi:hypothetical protein